MTAQRAGISVPAPVWLKGQALRQPTWGYYEADYLNSPLSGYSHQISVHGHWIKIKLKFTIVYRSVAGQSRRLSLTHTWQTWPETYGCERRWRPRKEKQT